MRKSRSDRMNRRILSALIGVPSRRPRLIRRLFALFPAIFAGFLLASGAPSLAGQTDGELERRARAIHDNVLTLDTHVDINASNFTAERNYTQRLDTQVNLPLMTEGGLDAAFFSSTWASRAKHAARTRLPPLGTIALTSRPSRSSRPFTG
jgi:hypothetical protein